MKHAHRFARFMIFLAAGFVAPAALAQAPDFGAMVKKAFDDARTAVADAAARVPSDNAGTRQSEGRIVPGSTAQASELLDRRGPLFAQRYRNPNLILDDFDEHYTVDFDEGAGRRMMHAVVDTDAQWRVIVLRQDDADWQVVADMKVPSLPSGLKFVGTIPPNPDFEAPPLNCFADNRAIFAFGFMKSVQRRFEQQTDRELVWTLDPHANPIPLRDVKVVCKSW